MTYNEIMTTMPENKKASVIAGLVCGYLEKFANDLHPLLHACTEEDYNDIREEVMDWLEEECDDDSAV